jgi:hypothetical protein
VTIQSRSGLFSSVRPVGRVGPRPGPST